MPKRTCILLLLSMAMVLTFQSQQMPECNTTYTTLRTNSFFKINNILLDKEAISITILDTNTETCALNTATVKQRLAIPDKMNMFIGISLHCQHGHAVNIVNDELHNDNNVAIIEVEECAINIIDLMELGGLFETRVLDLWRTHGQPVNKTVFTETHCLRLELIGSYVYDTADLQENIHSFEDVFWCSESFPLMAEVLFKNVSWDILPDKFEQKFPNLQSLEIPHNKFIFPPAGFPWTDETMDVPRNLTRTSNMDDGYTTSFGLTIPSNIYRRVFNLDYNNIEDLSNFSFHGFLHRISIKGNRLNSIGFNTFSNVIGLQALDLSMNDIQVLQDGLFRNLISVTSINLSRNALKHLGNGTFDHLTYVSLINLAENKLTSIGAGTFTDLLNLTEIHLENNNLEYLLPDSFPLDSLMLKKIILHHNPLHTIPEFIFWLRNIKFVDLSHASIALDNFTSYLADMNVNRVSYGIVDSGSSTAFENIMTRADKLRYLDLSFNRIRRLSIERTASLTVMNMAAILLLHYEFDFSHNPLICDCYILSISKLINGLLMEQKIDKSEYYFTDWYCEEPSELHGAKLLEVKPEQTYCPVQIEDCPTECSCYRRSLLGSIIVDCRSLDLLEMPNNLPKDLTLELWYSDNNIKSIHPMSCLKNVISLDVSHNRIKDFPAETFNMMVKLQRLYLHDNLLSYLPEDITQRQLQHVTMYPNPLHCDCNSRWLKEWLKRTNVTSYDKVTCNLDSNEDGKVVIEVPDEAFTCPEIIDTLKNDVLPSIVSSVVLAIIIMLLFILYAYRLEVKVLMFVYFGIHPFDKDSSSGVETLDCVVVHSQSSTDWVMDRIVGMLESGNYRYVVCDMARDFIIGFSFQEIITKNIRRSKRIIFCLSTDWNASIDNFNTAWIIAQEKIRDSKSHFAILITHGVSRSDIQNEELRLFIKHGRFVDSRDRLFSNKILYYMPRCPDSEPSHRNTSEGLHTGHKCANVCTCFEEERNINEAIDTHICTPMPKSLYAPCDAFIYYADDDIRYVINVLQSHLEDKGFSLIIPDRDFVVGASKEENILNAIKSSQRTIFVLSEKLCRDEWSLFTFRAAFEKTLRDKSNHLLIVILEDIGSVYLDSEIDHYLNNYICLHVNDRWFEQRLLNGMPYMKVCRHNQGH